MTKKLAPPKEWYNRDIDDWITTSFTEYLRHKHEELFNLPYVPFGGWQAEQRIIGDIIGTKSGKNPKPRKYDNEMLKKFIDVTFEGYRPTKQYPGTSLGFHWKYNQREWQRVIAGHNEVKKEESVAIDWEAKADEIDEYF